MAAVLTKHSPNGIPQGKMTVSQESQNPDSKRFRRSHLPSAQCRMVPVRCCSTFNMDVRVNGLLTR